MNIFYLYSQPRKNWERHVKLKRMPDHVLYGLNWLKQFGHQVTYSDAAFSRFNLLKWLISPLQHWFLHHYGVGFQLDQALLLFFRLRRSDVIITTNDSCGLPVAWLKWLGLLKTPQIYCHIGFKRQSKLLSLLLHQPEMIIDFAKTPLGIDTEFFHPKKTKPKIDILAVGRDPGRDYITLFRAVAELPLTVLVICDPKNIAGLTIPPNLTIKHFASYLQVRQAYREAKLVVIPTQSNVVSGQISLLEALACGKPTLASATLALKRLGAQAYYQPGNPNDLRHHINFVLKQPQINHHHHGISSRDFAQNLNSLVAAVAKLQ